MVRVCTKGINRSMNTDCAGLCTQTRGDVAAQHCPVVSLGVCLEKLFRVVWAGICDTKISVSLISLSLVTLLTYLYLAAQFVINHSDGHLTEQRPVAVLQIQIISQSHHFSGHLLKLKLLIPHVNGYGCQNKQNPFQLIIVLGFAHMLFLGVFFTYYLFVKLFLILCCC